MLFLGSSSPAPRCALFQVGQPDSHSRSSKPRGQTAEQPLIKPQRVLCSTAEGRKYRAASLSWLLGGCWENPSAREKGFGPRSQGEASSSLLSVLRLERGSGHFH